MSSLIILLKRNLTFSTFYPLYLFFIKSLFSIDYLFNYFYVGNWVSEKKFPFWHFILDFIYLFEKASEKEENRSTDTVLC